MSAENVVYLAVGLALGPLAWYARRLYLQTIDAPATARMHETSGELPEPIANLEHALATSGLLEDITVHRDDARAIVVHCRELEAVRHQLAERVINRARHLQYLEGRNDVLTAVLRAPEAVTFTRRGDAHVVRVGTHEASALDISEALRSALESRRQFDAEHRDALRSQEGYL